jgi:preprotein translocase subunit SecF
MASFAEFGNDLYTGKRSFPIVAKRKRWFAIAATIIAISLLLLLVRQLNPGIEFRGGSEFLVSGAENATEAPAREVLEGMGGEQVPRVTIIGDSSVRVQTEQLTSEETNTVQQELAEAYGVPEEDVTSSFVGPSWGADVTRKALQGLVTFLVLVTLVMAAYFRTWSMAVAALVALLNDVVVTVGLYAGVGFEVTPASVIGFLTILGYSLYDTVVVFDKVRENTQGITEQSRMTYAEASNLAVNQTIVRSVNTSVVGVLPVASILFVGAFLLGAGTLRDIALALFIGMLASTLSSIFIASPLEVALRERWSPDVAAHTAKVLAARAGTGGEDASAVPAPARVGGLVSGTHLGHGAQPHRRKRR